MGFQQNPTLITLQAAGDFATVSKYGYAVYIDANGRFALCGANAKVDGILTQAGVPQYAECPAQVEGVAEVVFGGNVAAGAYVTTDANGATVAGVATNICYGKCIEGGAAGQKGTVLLYPAGYVHP